MIIIISFKFVIPDFYDLLSRKTMGCWFGCYCIVGDSLTHNFQKTILTLGTTSSMVKFVKHENDINHTFLQCSNTHGSSIFIELFDSSSNKDLIAPPLSTKSPKAIPQSITQLSPQPSNSISNIQFVVSCLHVMVLPRHTFNEL